MREVALVAGVVVAALGAVAGCTLDKTGGNDVVDAGGRDATVIDAGADSAIADGAIDVIDADADSAIVDAGPDVRCASGLLCGGECSPGSTCTTCSAGKIECFATGGGLNACTGDCAQDCPGAPIGCFACGISPNGACQAAASAYCLTIAYPHCACTHQDPSTCPIASHVCVDLPDGGAECRTCGEPGTDDQDCKGGKKCMALPPDKPPSCTRP
jgi:hypothetical protein